MNLNRRDFAKTGLGGLLAFLLPGKAKAKPKSKFPRWFGLHRLVEYGVWPEYNTQAILWEAKAENHAIVYWPDGRCGHMRDHYRGTKMPSSTLAALEYDVSHGFIVEIPAVAAEAILKSKPGFPRYFAAATIPYASSAVVRVDDAVTVVSLCPDAPKNHRLPCTLRQLEQWDTWREITAAEAKALLKPKSMPWRTLTMEFPCSRKQAEMLHRLHKAEERRIKSLLNETFWK